MMRVGHYGAFLVVEGVSDVRFWYSRHHDLCELVDGEGKENVVGAVGRLDTDGISGVLGVVDDDYDSVSGITYPSANLVATDAHDLECILCRSSALETVLAEFGVPHRIRAFEKAACMDVRSGLLERAMVFGRVRWAAVRHNLDIDVKALRVPRFTDTNTWVVDGDELVRAVSKKSTSSDCDVLKRRIAGLPRANPWQIVNGHDMVQILRIGLRHVLGKLPVRQGPEDVARVLRAAVSLPELQTSRLYRDMRAWELQSGYTIFPD